MYCNKCGKSLSIRDKFCSNCGEKIKQPNKEVLNNSLPSFYFLGKAVFEYGLINAKYVNVKKERYCNNCNHKINVGELSLTSSMNEHGFPVRIWRCLSCAKSLIDNLTEDDMEEQIWAGMPDEY